VVATAKLLAWSGDGAIGGEDTPHRFLVQYTAGQQQGSTLTLNDRTYYARGDVGIASVELWNTLAMRMVMERSYLANELFELTARIPALHTARGHQFERRALKALSAGGNFRVRRLPSTTAPEAGDLTWTLSPGPILLFADLRDIRRHSQSKLLLYPSAANLAGLDALVWVPDLGRYAAVDFAVASRHGIHEKGLRAALEALGSTEDDWPRDSGSGLRAGAAAGAARDCIPYVWVVPEDMWDTWTRAQAAKSGTGDAHVHRQLVQYALSVPIPLDDGSTTGATS
jgi:hypothetical protein